MKVFFARRCFFFNGGNLLRYMAGTMFTIYAVTTYFNAPPIYSALPGQSVMPTLQDADKSHHRNILLEFVYQ